MNKLEMLSVGASLILSWGIVGSPLYNFYQAREKEKEAERIREENYDKEFSKLVEEYVVEERK